MLPKHFNDLSSTGSEDFQVRKADGIIDLYRTIDQAYSECLEDTSNIDKLSWITTKGVFLRWRLKKKGEKWNPISEMLLCKLNPLYDTCAVDDKKQLFWVLQNITHRDEKFNEPYYCDKEYLLEAMNEFEIHDSLMYLQLASSIISILTDEEFREKFNITNDILQVPDYVKAILEREEYEYNDYIGKLDVDKKLISGESKSSTDLLKMPDYVKALLEQEAEYDYALRKLERDHNPFQYYHDNHPPTLMLFNELQKQEQEEEKARRKPMTTLPNDYWKCLQPNDDEDIIRKVEGGEKEEEEVVAIQQKVSLTQIDSLMTMNDDNDGYDDNNDNKNNDFIMTRLPLASELQEMASFFSFGNNGK